MVDFTQDQGNNEDDSKVDGNVNFEPERHRPVVRLLIRRNLFKKYF